MIQEDFVTYTQAIKLKELGFDLECFYFYNKNGNLRGYIIETGGEERTIELDDFKENWNYWAFDKISAPTLALVQKWLREEKKIHLWVESELNEYDSSIVYNFYIFDSNRRVYLGDCDKIMCQNTYEKALSIGIDHALEIIKNK